MNELQMKSHALTLAGIYGFLLEDTSHRVYDVDAHNLCSAVVEREGVEIRTFVSYSNPSSIKSLVGPYELVGGDVDDKLVDRGGMQDLHTEVRLINHLHAAGLLVSPNVVTFFSSRSVCDTCREAILDTMQRLEGRVPFMALEFKAELFGTIGSQVYPIQQNPHASAPPMDYVSGPYF